MMVFMEEQNLKPNFLFEPLLYAHGKNVNDEVVKFT